MQLALFQIVNKQKDDPHFTLYVNPDLDDGKEVINMFWEAKVGYMLIPTYALEVCAGPRGLYRAQGMDQIKELLSDYLSERASRLSDSSP